MSEGYTVCAASCFAVQHTWYPSKQGIAVVQVASGGKLRLRSDDPSYLTLVDRWWAVLLPRIAHHLYIRGGNVLMVQVGLKASLSAVLCAPTFAGLAGCISRIAMAITTTLTGCSVLCI